MDTVKKVPPSDEHSTHVTSDSSTVRKDLDRREE
jgi:hypothetical protein